MKAIGLTGRLSFFFYVIFCCLSLVDCRPSSSKTNVSVKNTYFQDFKSDVAWIVIEWNGTIYGYGSGFLINKEKGAFYTNKHVSDTFNKLGQGSQKIFFNGRVYKGALVKTPPLRDAAIVRIAEQFDPSEFPEPATISEQKVKIGDAVLLGGFHPHPYVIREADKAEGYDYPVVPIYKDYYKMGTRDNPDKKEIVFERLVGKVVKLDVTLKEIIERSGDKLETQEFVEDIRDRTNLYIQVQISKDHKFSFGGLSGSATRNSKGEIIGILTIQDIERPVFDTVYLTPIDSVKDLSSYIK